MSLQRNVLLTVVLCVLSVVLQGQSLGDLANKTQADRDKAKA